MTTYINYLLKAFGFRNYIDFNTTVFKTIYLHNGKWFVYLSVTLGTTREFIEQSMGLDLLVLACFVGLIIAEWQTGVRADMKKRNKKFSSRKAGRMIIKIGVYMWILFMLYTFASRTKNIEFVGFEVNPLGWLYYIVFTWITFQLLVSYFENLSVLGYKEATGIVGIILRKGNKWFDFDGTKNQEENFENQEGEETKN